MPGAHFGPSPRLALDETRPAAARRRSRTSADSRLLICGSMVAAFAFVLAACGSTQGGHVNPTHSRSKTASVKPSAGATSGVGHTGDQQTSARSFQSLPYRYDFTITRAGGYRFSGVLAIGTPEHIDQATVTAGAETFDASDDSCPADATTDAAIPGTLTIINDTSGFSAGTGLAIWFGGSPIQNEAVAADLSSGPTCDSPSDDDQGGNLIQYTLSPEGSSTMPLMIHVPNYYSPDHPNGDLGILHGGFVAVESSDHLSLSGPGAKGVPGGIYEVPLTPPAVAGRGTVGLLPPLGKPGTKH
jgi:hypothetical protein